MAIACAAVCPQPFQNFLPLGSQSSAYQWIGSSDGSIQSPASRPWRWLSSYAVAAERVRTAVENLSRWWSMLRPALGRSEDRIVGERSHPALATRVINQTRWESSILDAKRRLSYDTDLLTRGSCAGDEVV
jgi:hypothetical protein